jgi:hypothetical protein
MSAMPQGTVLPLVPGQHQYQPVQAGGAGAAGSGGAAAAQIVVYTIDESKEVPLWQPQPRRVILASQDVAVCGKQAHINLLLENKSYSAYLVSVGRQWKCGAVGRSSQQRKVPAAASTPPFPIPPSLPPSLSPPLPLPLSRSRMHTSCSH